MKSSNDINIYIPLQEKTNEIPLNSLTNPDIVNQQEKEAREPFLIYIKYMDNSQKSIDINDLLDLTVIELHKLAFPEKYNDEAFSIRLIYQGRLLKNEELIQSLNLQNNGYIHAIINEKVQSQINSEIPPIDANQPNLEENINNDTRALQLVSMLMEAQRQNEAQNNDNVADVRLNSRENGGGMFVMGVFFGFFFSLWAVLIMYLCNFPEKAKTGVLFGFFLYVIVKAVNSILY